MEGDNVVDLSITGGAAAVAAAGYSRWNPTKEQIDMLEGLYKQGIRTPSAEQIQQITNRLRAFGHIEGKNVFYWFQNHKARQRQKQKQDTISYFNRFLNKTSVFPPCPNVICSPFCIPYADLGLSHQQQPKVLLPRAFKRKSAVPEKMAATTNPTGGALENMENDHQNYCNVTEECLIKRKHRCNNQTLDLFPLHPSGNLQARTSSSSLASNSLGDSGVLTTPANSSSDSKCITVEQGGSSGTGPSTGHLFFDFFCENYGSCESH